MRLTTSVCTAAFAALLMAGCGGGGGGQVAAPAPADNQPPVSASASSAGMLSYIGQLTVSSSDSAAPVDLSAFVPPSDAGDSAVPVATANDAPSVR